MSQAFLQSRLARDRCLAPGASVRARQRESLDSKITPGLGPKRRKMRLRTDCAQALGLGRVAVQLDDVAGRDPGRLVQIVDVLRDDGRHLAAPVETRQRAVPPARARLAETVLQREPAPPGLLAHLLAGQEIVEID